jgi:hypothetical protein
VKNINTKAFLAAIAAVVMIVAVAVVWVWRAPSVSVGQPPSRAEVNAAMKDSHSQPTPDQMKQIQEWKKTHPGAYTKY